MMYTIHAGGAVLAELDLEALYQQGKSPLQVGTLQPCPSCGETPTFYKDRGCWYMVGAIHPCPVCGGARLGAAGRRRDSGYEGAAE